MVRQALRQSITEYKRPILGISQIANQAMDQKPHRYPSRNVLSQVSSTLDAVNATRLGAVNLNRVPQGFLNPHTIVECAFDADGNRIPLDLHGLTRDEEQTVDVMWSTPGLHHRLVRVSPSAPLGGRRLPQAISVGRSIEEPSARIRKQQKSDD